MAAHSLGRQPRDSKKRGTVSREAATASSTAATCWRPFAATAPVLRVPWAYAQGYMLSPRHGYKYTTSQPVGRPVQSPSFRLERPAAGAHETQAIDGLF
jgi:hypothetical protein